MPPEELEALIRSAILAIRDEGIYEANVEEEEEYKTSIARVSDNWSAVDRFLTDE